MGHTPGPWRVLIDDDGNPLSGRPGVFASDELDCGIVHWDGFVQDHWRSARGDKEIHANAHLIAAAPDLLEELEQQADGASTIIALLEGQTGPVAASLRGMLSIQEQAARAAIAKATGKP